MSEPLNETELEVSTSQLDPERVREKLLLVVEEWAPKLPEQLKKFQQGSNSMPITMLLTAAKPFLPQLSKILTSTIEDAAPEKIMELVSFVDGVSTWLKADS